MTLFSRMISWKGVHLWMGIAVVLSLLGGFVLSSLFSFGTAYGLGLGWLNLFSLFFLGKSLRQQGKVRFWYFPLWFTKWVLLGSLLYLALKASLPPLALVGGFTISLVILALLSFGSIRDVLHSRSS